MSRGFPPRISIFITCTSRRMTAFPLPQPATRCAILRHSPIYPAHALNQASSSPFQILLFRCHISPRKTRGISPPLTDYFTCTTTNSSGSGNTISGADCVMVNHGRDPHRQPVFPDNGKRPPHLRTTPSILNGTVTGSHLQQYSPEPACHLEKEDAIATTPMSPLKDTTALQIFHCRFELRI